MILELCKGVHCVDLGESFQTHIFLQNLASIQPRTSPLKFARSSKAILLTRTLYPRPIPVNCNRRETSSPPPPLENRDSASLARLSHCCCTHREWLRPIGKISAKCCSFSAVSAPIFARKYAFDSIFQNLPDYHAEIFEIWQQFANFAKIAKFSILPKFSSTMC